MCREYQGTMGKMVRWCTRILGLLLFLVAIVATMLWVLFPRDYLQGWIPRYVAHAYPPFTVELGAIHLALPDKLVIKNLGVGTIETERPLISTEEITLRPDYPRLLHWRPAARFTVTMYKGRGAGSIVYEDEQISVDGTLTSLQLEELHELSTVLGRSLRGTLSASYTKQIAGDRGQQLSMQLSAENGAVELKQPLFGHTSIPFTIVECLVTNDNAVVTLNRGHMESTLFVADFNGTVFLHTPLDASELAIEGTLQPRPEFFSHVDDAQLLQNIRAHLQDEELSFQISGDVAVPGIRFGALTAIMQDLHDKVGQ